MRTSPISLRFESSLISLLCFIFFSLILEDKAELSREDQLLSPELEELARSCGCKQESIEKFKLAWACYDLLNKLGDPCFWANADADVAASSNMAMRDSVGSAGGNSEDSYDDEGAYFDDLDDLTDANFSFVALESYSTQRKEAKTKADSDVKSYKWLESDAYIESLEQRLESLKKATGKKDIPRLMFLKQTIDEANARRTLAADLQLALDRNEFELADSVESRLNGLRQEALEVMRREDEQQHKRAAAQQQHATTSTTAAAAATAAEAPPPEQLTTDELVRWARELRRGSKDPFAYDVIRKTFGNKADHPTISRWWRLYRRFGSRRAAKNFDFTRSKQISFRFYATGTNDRWAGYNRGDSFVSDVSESVSSLRSGAGGPAKSSGTSSMESLLLGGDDQMQELTMFYCSRAKPKEYVGAASQLIVPG